MINVPNINQTASNIGTTQPKQEKVPNQNSLNSNSSQAQNYTQTIYPEKQLLFGEQKKEVFIILLQLLRMLQRQLIQVGSI